MQNPKDAPVTARGEFMEQIELWSNFILANLLWAIISIPLVTLPAATAGLFAVMSKRIRGQEGELIQTFFDTMRSHWRGASAIMLLNLLLGGIILLNLRIFALANAPDVMMFMSRSVTLFVGLIVLLANLYAWPLLVMADLRLRELIILSFKLVFAYPLRSFIVFGAALLPLLISLLLPQGVFALVTVSAIVWIIAKGTWPVIHPLTTEAA